jgi:heme/copper-type cytochrome/quinol oxidase subunit 3
MKTNVVQFALVFAVYYLVVTQFFDKTIRPVGKKLQRDLIPLPKDVIDIWVLVAGSLFPMLSVVRARESDWDPKASRGAMASFLGVALGMIVNVH